LSFRLGYDPISHELIIDVGSETVPPISVSLDAVPFTYYDNTAAIRFSMGPEGIDVALDPVRNNSLTLRLASIGKRRWRLQLVPDLAVEPILRKEDHGQT
jgi:hypothetical protein